MGIGFNAFKSSLVKEIYLKLFFEYLLHLMEIVAPPAAVFDRSETFCYFINRLSLYCRGC
jgi:hypothetical protein